MVLVTMDVLAVGRSRAGWERSRAPNSSRRRMMVVARMMTVMMIIIIMRKRRRRRGTIR